MDQLKETSSRSRSGVLWLRGLEEGEDGENTIPLDSDRKATFASNRMTVIASDSPTNPVVNVGTLNR